MRGRGAGLFVVGLVVGLLIPALTVFAYFRFGYAPVATAAPPIPFERTAARLALRARIAREAPRTVPIEAGEPTLLAGAAVYRDNCAVCHGQPQASPTAIANGMYPSPPQLFEHTVADDPVGMTYWKVANGIRMTGMPSFRNALSDEQIWQVSLLLAHAEALPERVTRAVGDRSPEPARTAPTSGRGDEGRIAPHGDERR